MDAATMDRTPAQLADDAEREMRRGLLALRLEAPAAVVDDLTKLVEAAIEAKVAELDDALEIAWVLIANASGSDWTRESPEWQEGAARWRDRVLPDLSKRVAARSAS